MTTIAFKLDPVIEKFPTLLGNTQKIATALAAEERGAHLATGFLPYTIACQNLISSSTRLRATHKDLDTALQALSLRVQAAYAKIAPSEFLTALRNNDLKTVETILKISDLQNKALPNGETPLHYAIRSGSLDVVKYLLSNAQINPFAKDHQGLAAFDHAYIMKNPKMIALVLGASLGTTIPESSISATPDRDELQLMLQEMAALRRPPVSKLQPLQAAAFLDDLKGLEKLSHETDIHSPDQNGMTALHYAVLGGKTDAVQWLLAKGAKLDGKGVSGMNLLHLAVINGSEAVFKLLLNTKTLDLNAGDARGRTPLHFALISEQLNIARTLIERGGDPLAKTMRTTPIAIFNYVSQIKASYRDPLTLDPISLYILGSFAASAACQYFGKADAHDFRRILALAGKALSALPVIGTIYSKSRSRSAMALPAALSLMPALSGYFNDIGSIKAFFEGLHTLSLGATLVDNLRICWDNSAIETYRPLRNALVHGTNALFSAWECWNSSGIKPRLVYQFLGHEQYISQEGELKSEWVLGLEEGHTKEQCKRAYKKLSFEYHPDKATDPIKKLRNEILMPKINMAKAALTLQDKC